MIYRILFLCFFFSVSSCKPEIISNQEIDTFFDLDKYVNLVVADSISSTVLKTVRVNGASEQKKLTAYPLWRDIKNFAQYNINKPALFDKYQVDTLRMGNQVQVSYLSLEEKHYVQELDIWYQNQNIDSIRILSSLKSFIEKSNLEINWIPGSGYVIDKTVHGRFSKEKSQQISVEVL